MMALAPSVLRSFSARSAHSARTLLQTCPAAPLQPQHGGPFLQGHPTMVCSRSRSSHSARTLLQTCFAAPQQIQYGGPFLQGHPTMVCSQRLLAGQSLPPATPSPRIITAQHWLTDLPNTDVIELLFQRFRSWPDHQAIVCEKTGRGFLYREFEECSLRWGAALLQLMGGRGPGCVAILAHNIPEYPVVVFGALAVGATVTTVATALTPAEILRQWRNSGAGLVVVDSALEDRLVEALQTVPAAQLPLVVTIGGSKEGFLNFDDIIHDASASKAVPVKNPADKIALILYSSGTTGTPKGVCLPHGSLSNFLSVFSHPAFYPHGAATAEHQETSLGLMPFYHSFGMFALAFTSWFLGCKIVCLPKMKPQDYAEAVEKYQVRVLHMVPPLLNFLANSPTVTPQHLASVRTVLIAGAPVHPALAKAFKDKAPNKINFQEGLGLTETLALMVTPLDEERLGWCGRLLPNTEARVVDDAGTDLGPGQRGELWVRGSGFMSHYHNNPEATAAALDSEGWFKTGDVVEYSEDGFFRVVDRIKELIKVKALQVSPTEVEELVLQVAGVAEVGVVGVPDPRAGELPRAYVVLKQPTTDGGALEQVRAAIEQHMAANAAPYKQLAAGIVFVKELPKNATGKMMRRELRDRARKEWEEHNKKNDAAGEAKL